MRERARAERRHAGVGPGLAAAPGHVHVGVDEPRQQTSSPQLDHLAWDVCGHAGQARRDRDDALAGEQYVVAPERFGSEHVRIAQQQHLFGAEDSSLIRSARRMSEGVGRVGLTRTIAEQTLEQVGRPSGEVYLQRGAALGRYIVLERLGAGGMGVVYAAFDPELDRRVALKVLRVGGEQASEGRARLLREAQAMARLSHPNVVVVHDVGTVDRQVFVAMELVDGHTLKQWRKERPRSWQEILAVMVPVARGLEAVHAAGIVHRDVKPDNIMVARDGRVRLMDLGLARTDPPPVDREGQARARAGTGGGEHSATGESGGRERGLSSITEHGIVPGTPAYMAPELHARGEFEPRTDQFALGVTLYEALWGVRPFEGHSLLELASNVMEGRMRSPPRDSDVPAWLRQIVLRTLQLEPAARFPDIATLTGELTRDRRRHGLRAVAAMVAIAGGVLVVRAAIGADDRELCHDEGAAIDGTWNDERRQAIAQVITAGRQPFAADTVARVAEQLDRYAADWTALRTEVCVAEHARAGRDDQGGDELPLRRACLDDRRAELGALVEVLAGSSGTVAERALPATMELTRVERCTDGAYLAARRGSWSDAARGERVSALRERLAEARALERAGRYEDGATLTREIAGEAEALGERPLLAAARVRLGSLHRMVGEYAEAEQSLVDAFVDARWSRLDPSAIEAAVLLTYVVGVDLGRPAEALVWSRIAEGELGPDGEHSEPYADLLSNIGNVYATKSDYPHARAYLERAIAVAIDSYGADHLQVAKYRANLSPMLAALGEPEQAVTTAEQALATAEAVLGVEHPSVASFRNNLCTALFGADRLAEASRCAIDLLAFEERVLGPEHPNLAIALNNVGAFMHVQGRNDEAYRYYLRARAIVGKSVPDDHPRVAGIEYNLGTVARLDGRHEDAVAHHRLALAIREKQAGADHSEVADSCAEIADSLVALGRLDEADALLQRALAIRERAPDQAVMLANVRARIGLLAVARGHAADARRELEAGLAVLEREHTDAEITARARRALDAVVERAPTR
jgi:eukaryotic-like serine/threonine-protein kinase